MSIPPTIKILHKNSCLHGISQHFSAIKCWISCLKQSRLWFAEWLDPNYLKDWPFGILTEKAIVRTPLRKKKTRRKLELSVTQGIVRYSGRVKYRLGSCNTGPTLYSTGLTERGSFSNDDPCRSYTKYRNAR